MRIINCSKCGKSYAGSKSFQGIAEDNNLEKAGNYYYCKGCSTLGERLTAKGHTAKLSRFAKDNKIEIGNDNVI